MEKKLISLLLVLLIPFLIFANGSSEKEPVIDESKPADVVLLLDQDCIGVDTNSPIIKMINERFNINVSTMELDSADMYENLNVRIAGGEMPDAFLIKTIGSIPQYVKGGVLHEVPEEMIRELAPNYSAAIDEIDPLLWRIMRYDGKNWGLGNPLSVPPLAMVYNKKWLDNLGLEVPTTLEELEEVLLAFVNDDPDGNGIDDTAGCAERVFSAVFGAYGLRVSTSNGVGFRVEDMQLDAEGLPFFPYIDERAKEPLELLHRWYELGILDKEFITGENHGGYRWISHSFINGRIGLTCAFPRHYLTASYNSEDPLNWGPCMKEFKALDPSNEIVFGPAPIGPYGHSGTEMEPSQGKLIVFTQRAFEDPRRAEAILKMIDAFYADIDYAVLTAYGIEGEDFVNTEYGPTRIIDGMKAREKGIMQFNLNATIPFEKAVRPKQHEFMKEVAPIGYDRISIPMTDSYSKYISNLDVLTEQAYFDMITGKKPLSYFDTFVQEFKKAGGEAAENDTRAVYKENFM